MVSYIIEYYINTETVEDYLKFAEEEGIPYWLSVPGLEEFGAYRDDVSGKVLLVLKFESYKAWGKATDDPKTKEIMTKFRSYIHGLSWKLWGSSPVIPEPLKPKK